MLTCPYVFDADDGARSSPRPAPTCVVAHVDTTVAGLDRREDGGDVARRSGASACRRCTTRRSGANPDVIVLCHGGPIAEPEDAQYVLARTTGVAGFFGASSIERLATETASRRRRAGSAR